eukprot:10893376-Prorocentrum_lima.AAC.1
MRATELGELISIDHAELVVDKEHLSVLVVVDGMSNFVWVGPQKSKTQVETIRALLRCKDELM